MTHEIFITAGTSLIENYYRANVNENQNLRNRLAQIYGFDVFLGITPTIPANDVNTISCGNDISQFIGSSFKYWTSQQNPNISSEYQTLITVLATKNIDLNNYDLTDLVIFSTATVPGVYCAIVLAHLIGHAKYRNQPGGLNYWVEVEYNQQGAQTNMRFNWGATPQGNNPEKILVKVINAIDPSQVDFEQDGIQNLVRSITTEVLHNWTRKEPEARICPMTMIFSGGFKANIPVVTLTMMWIKHHFIQKSISMAAMFINAQLIEIPILPSYPDEATIMAVGNDPRDYPDIRVNGQLTSIGNALKAFVDAIALLHP